MRRNQTLKTIVATVAAVFALLGAGAVVVIQLGLYEVAADRPHTQVVYSLLEAQLNRSVQRRARSIAERPLGSPAVVQRGAACYAQHCLACHGAPGVGPALSALSMQPLPGPLNDAALQWRPRELLWIIRHGIRMSGMPAWGTRLSEDDQWALVAMLQALPAVGPAQWADLQPLHRSDAGPSCALLPQPQAEQENAWVSAPAVLTDVVAARGLIALHRHGCHGCHQIPGLTGSQRHVGPPLAGLARRTHLVAGLQNTPANLASWIQRPQHHAPGTAMPDSGVASGDARDMAAYLGTLH